MQPLKLKISLPFDTRLLISQTQHSVSFQFSRHHCSIVAAIKYVLIIRINGMVWAPMEFKDLSPIGFNTF